MSRQKIAIILSRFPYPLDKGDKLRAFHQIKHISREFDIHLYCLSDLKVEQSDIEMLQPFCQKIQIYYLSRINRVLQSALALIKKIPVQVGYFYSSSIKKSIQTSIIQLNPALLYCQLSRTAYYGKDLPFKKVIDFQDAFSINYERIHLNYSGIKKWFYKRESMAMQHFETLMTTWFDECTIISNFDKTNIKCNSSNLHVISNGVDHVYFQSTFSTKKFDILFSGNLAYLPNKNAVRFLAEKITPLLIKQMPDVRIQVVGASGDELKKYETSNLHVHGWIDDIREAYNESQIFMAPLFTGAGLQNKLLEAMSMGVPCIITPITNASLMATENEHVLIAQDANEFVEKALTLLNDKSLKEKLATNARIFIEQHYSWEQANGNLVKLFKDTTGT